MEHGLITDIAVCIVAAWVVGVTCQVARQPLLLAYLAAGYAIGPHGFKWVTNAESIQTIASIGLILLLFMIGLEMDLKKMFSAGKALTLTAVSQIVGCIILGLVFFKVTGLGHTGLEALYLAVAAAMSSTVIIIKILHDKHELETVAGRITLGVLVLQDLAVILFLAIQPNLKDPSLIELLLAFGKVSLLVGVAYVTSRFLLPPVFKSVARQPELVLVGALAWCFAMAGFAGELGLSREMGALIAGVMVSTFPYTLDVVAKITSIRDFFVTLFFVGLGMSIPFPTLDLLFWMVVVSLFVVGSRLLTVFPALYALRMGHRVSLLPAINLCQISELSLVLLTLGKASGDVSERSVSVAAFAFAFLAVDSTYAILKNDQILRKTTPWLKRAGLPDIVGTGISPVDGHSHARIYVLGFSWTASSLLEELTRVKPELLSAIRVVDFNPQAIERLRRRRVEVVYGDIGQRDVLTHAGVSAAEIIICTVPDLLLKGITNLKLLRQLRELNPGAKIIMHADKVEEIPKLYAAGADYVLVSRLLEAEELMGLLDAADKQLLDQKRKAQAEKLENRSEVLA
jgi:Kef-type K+ transport system membrane component KefB